jgi:hypothetical protein
MQEQEITNQPVRVKIDKRMKLLLDPRTELTDDELKVSELEVFVSHVDRNLMYTVCAFSVS